MSIAAVQLPAEQHLLLSHVNWEKYDLLLHELDGRHLRFNFDRGQLEIMTVSPEHERIKNLLARLFEALTEELDIPVVGLGNTTFRREDAARGLEPDECWYVRHEEQMRDKDEIDLFVDPPPDLVIEVEISRSVLDRLEIYAALGVPEVWRCDGDELRVEVLDSSGAYTESTVSPTFPKVPLSGIVEHLRQRGQIDETRLVKSFRAWVRANVAP